MQNRIIFESEEECKQTYISATGAEIGWMSFVVGCRKAGLIRPDPVKEAEEMYEEYGKAERRNLLNVKQHEAIQLMKPYYEKHKGEIK